MCVQTRPFIVGHAVETLIYSSASVFHFTSTLEAFAMHSHGYCNWRGSRSLLLYIHHSPGWCCNKLTINSNLPVPRQAGAMMTTRCALGDLMHACTWAWCVHCKAWSSLCPSPPNTIWSLLSFRAFQTPGGVNWWQPVVTKMISEDVRQCHEKLSCPAPQVMKESLPAYVKRGLPDLKKCNPFLLSPYRDVAKRKGSFLTE